MKFRSGLMFLLSAFLWISVASAIEPSKGSGYSHWTTAKGIRAHHGTNPVKQFDPAVVAVNPQLEQLYHDFSPAQIFYVTGGVYVARGYNRDNPVLIDGPQGLIVIDPGESIRAAEVVKAAFNAHLGNIFSRKPVSAIIYTHHHDCHIHGASVFAGENTVIIGHENLMETLFYDWYSQLYPSRLVSGAEMSGSLFAHDRHWFAGGGLFARQIHGDSGFLPPTLTVRDRLDINIAGVDMRLFSAPGETRDVLVIWLPHHRTLVQIANLYEAFPAITTLRGAYPRDPLSYISSIDLYRSLEPEYLVLIHGPNPVQTGKNTINRIFTNYRDAIQFVHDQTVQYMNKGLTPGEIAALVKLPPHLAGDSFLQEVYGEIDRNIYEIFWWYRGSFSGRCRDLFSQSPQEEAEMTAELAGGIEALAQKAAQLLDKGKLEWALELADNVLLLDPFNAGAQLTKNEAMLSLAEETLNAQKRNYLLSEYLLETGQAGDNLKQITSNPKLAFANIDDHIVPIMPMDALFRIMAVSLNAAESLETDNTIDLCLTDLHGPMPECEEKDKILGICVQSLFSPPEPLHYALHVRRGILEVQAGTPEGSEFGIITDSLNWKNLVLGKLLPEEAVSSGKVVLKGADPLEFYAFMALFD